MFWKSGIIEQIIQQFSLKTKALLPL